MWFILFMGFNLFIVPSSVFGLPTILQGLCCSYCLWGSFCLWGSPFSRLPSSVFRLRSSVSNLPTLVFGLRSSVFRHLRSPSLLSPVFRLPASVFLLPSSCLVFLLPSSCFGLPASVFLLRSSFFRLPTILVLFMGFMLFMMSTMEYPFSVVCRYS